ncbi:MAG: hypothetical protein QM489_00765 [Candidatus Izemoplasma sp.]
MPSMNRGLAVVFTISFIKWLNKPFEEWPSFESGLINRDGKVLRKAENAAERKMMGPFSNLIRNLKRLLLKIPGGRSKFATALTTIALLKESHEINEPLMLERLEQMFNIDSEYKNEPLFAEFNNESFLLFDTIYNEIVGKVSIKVVPKKVEHIQLGRHQILKITDTLNNTYFI